MSFSQAIRSGFANYVNFAGRAARSEYWYWVLFVSLVGIAATALDRAFVANRHGPLEVVWHLATVLPSLALGVRRLHDTDRSGWWLVAVFAASAALVVFFVFVGLPFVPMAITVIGALVLIYWLVLFWWFCQPGTRGPNSYGADPFGAAGDITPRPTA